MKFSGYCFYLNTNIGRFPNLHYCTLITRAKRFWRCLLRIKSMYICIWVCVCVHSFKVLSPYWKVTTCFWIVGEHLGNYLGVYSIGYFHFGSFRTLSPLLDNLQDWKIMKSNSLSAHLLINLWLPCFFFAEDELFELQTAEDLAIIFKQRNFLKEDEERNVFRTALEIIERIDLVKKFQIYIAASKS